MCRELEDAAFHESNRLAVQRWHIAAQIDQIAPSLATDISELQRDADAVRGRTTTSLEQMARERSMDRSISLARRRQVRRSIHEEDRQGSLEQELERLGEAMRSFPEQELERIREAMRNFPAEAVAQQRETRGETRLEMATLLLEDSNPMVSPREGEENQDVIQREWQREHEEALERMREWQWPAGGR